MPNTDAITLCVSEFLAKRHESLGRSGLPAVDAPIFEAGLIDSLALIDLIAEVEACTHSEVDMLLFDPTKVVTATDLVRVLNEATHT